METGYLPAPKKQHMLGISRKIWFRSLYPIAVNDRTTGTDPGADIGVPHHGLWFRKRQFTVSLFYFLRTARQRLNSRKLEKDGKAHEKIPRTVIGNGTSFWTRELR